MGARLTNRLLSFSRQRKLEPAIVNLNELTSRVASPLPCNEFLLAIALLASALHDSRQLLEGYALCSPGAGHTCC